MPVASPTPTAKPLQFVSNSSGSLGISKPAPIGPPSPVSTTSVAQKPKAQVFDVTKPTTKKSVVVKKKPNSAVQALIKKQEKLESEVKPLMQETIGKLGSDIVGQSIGALPKVALQSMGLPAAEALGFKGKNTPYVPKSAVGKFFLGSEPVYSYSDIAKQGAGDIKKGNVSKGATTIGLGMVGALLDATPGGGGKKKAAGEAASAAKGLIKSKGDDVLKRMAQVGEDLKKEADIISDRIKNTRGTKETDDLVERAAIQSQINKNNAEQALVKSQEDKLRSLPESIKNSSQYPDEVKNKITSTYTPITNAETTKAAQEGLATNRDSVIQRVTGADDLDAVEFEQARLLIREAIEQGRMDDAVGLIEIASQKATKAGQSVQALRLWGEMTPEGALKYTQREIDKFNQADGGILNALNKGGKKSLSKDTAKGIADAAAEVQALPEGSEEKAKAITKLLDRVQEAIPATTAEKIAEWGKAIKLTSIRSIERNWLGSLTEVAYSPLKRLTASMVDAVEVGGKKLLGKEANREVYASDAIADLAGRVKGIQKGMKNFLKGIVEENPLGTDAVLDGSQKRAIKGKLGYVIRTPFRLMNDELFGAMAREAELAVEANRAARKAGLTGDAAKEFTDSFVKNPPENVLSRVDQAVKRATYKEDLGKMGSATQNLIKNVKFGPIPVGEIVVSFFKTPANIFKRFIAENTALAPIAKQNLDDLKKGGAAAQEAKAKMILGFGTSLGVGSYVMTGKVTGRGPKDKGEREMLEAQGWKPYSLKIGDKYVSYNNLGAVSLALGTAADTYEALGDYKSIGKEEATDALARASLAFGNNIYNQSFFTGIQDALDAIDDPANAGSRFLSNTAVGMILPAIVGDASRSIDTTVRQPKGFVETLKSRTPFLSKEVTPKRNIFGEEVKREESGIASFIQPFQTSTEVKSKTFDLLNSIDERIGRPSANIIGRKLNPAEADILQRETGRLTKGMIDELAKDENFFNAPADVKTKVIDEVIRKTRESVKQRLSARVELRSLGLDPEAPAEKKDLMIPILNDPKYKKLSDDQKRSILLEILKSQ